MGSYKNPVAWIAQSVLGNSRPVPHVRALLDHATVVNGSLVATDARRRAAGKPRATRDSGSDGDSDGSSTDSNVSRTSDSGDEC